MPPLDHWRSEFPLVDEVTYLVSHSLGAMPKRAAAALQEYADTWSHRGVRAWHEGWWEMGRETGDLLAPILGVETGTISMHQNVSVSMGIIGSCYRYDGRRRKIVLTDLEFPTNMYLFEGFRRYGADVVYVRRTTRCGRISNGCSTPSTSRRCSSRSRSCCSAVRTSRTRGR